MSLERGSVFGGPSIQVKPKIRRFTFSAYFQKVSLLFFPLIKSCHRSAFIGSHSCDTEGIPNHFVTKLLSWTTSAQTPCHLLMVALWCPLGKVVPQGALVLVLPKLQGTQLILFFILLEFLGSAKPFYGAVRAVFRLTIFSPMFTL